MAHKLSVFYIVRNEQDRISKSLESIKDIADEIVVVDTGSVDRTIDICKAFNGKIFKYRWNDSFSDVRNFALSKCSNKFVMYLDADEVLTDASGELLEKILLTIKQYSAYYIKITNKNDEFGVGENLKSPQIRLFYNDSTIKFKGIANESVEDSVYKSSKFSVLSSDLNIDHYPFYGRTKKDVKKKELYYKKIQSKKIRKEDLNIMVDTIEKSDIEQKKCAIIISVYNLLLLTKKCIDSVLKNTSYPFKLFIVNDGSNENTSCYINSIEGAKVINMGGNFGVSKCRNRAMRVALSDDKIKYICFLDNDTKVNSGWLKNLIESLEKSKCGMIGPISNSAIGDQRMVKNNWVSKFSNEKIVDMVSVNNKSRLKSTKFLNRFCQVFRSSIIKEIGFLDESFGKIGWEDNDFCRRFCEYNLDLMIDNGVYVYHQGHSTSALNNVNYFKYIQGGAKLFYKKWRDSSECENKVKDEIFCDYSITSPFTSIIVLTYNNLNINYRFFDALKKYTTNYELIVVDNGSTDGTLRYLDSMKNIKLIKNGKNVGIIKARNQGLNSASADYLICLDNDQIVKQDWLVSLHRKMDEGYSFVGVEAWEVDKSYMPIKRHLKFNHNIKIDYVGAGGCLMKRSVLNKIGIYDERFGMAYFEDVDICYRAIEAGYKVGWCDKRIINHLGNSTLIRGQNDFNYHDELASSHKIFFEKIKNKNKGKKYEEVKLDFPNIPVSVKGNFLSKNKLITFCMGLKGRSAAARQSIDSLVNEDTIKHFKFIIAEDESNDLLDLSTFKYAKYIDHYIINTGDAWNRSKTCNYGYRRVQTKYICSWDADFLFPNNFRKIITDIVLDTNFEKRYLSIGCTETASCSRRGSLFKAGDIYGGMYVYERDKLHKIGCYDETFLNYGWEEVDCHFRYERQFNVVRRRIEEKNIVFHKSHSEKLSGDLSFINKNRAKAYEHGKNKINIVNNGNQCGLSRLIKKVDYLSGVDSFYRFIRNKRVVIVGPAPSVVGSKQHDLIESYDVVVRVNKALPVSPDMYEDIGDRTDVLYNCLNQNPENGGPLPIDILVKNGVKYVCCPYGRKTWFAKEDIAKFEKVSHGIIPLHVIDSDYYNQLEKSMGTRPNTGTASILDILAHDIEELYITGFTFFKGGYYKRYRNMDEKTVLGRMDAHGNHKQEPQIEYIRKAFKNDCRIKVDSALREILV